MPTLSLGHPAAHSRRSADSGEVTGFGLLCRIRSEGLPGWTPAPWVAPVNALILAQVEKCVMLTAVTPPAISVPDSYTRKARKEETQLFIFFFYLQDTPGRGSIKRLIWQHAVDEDDDDDEDDFRGRP